MLVEQEQHKSYAIKSATQSDSKHVWRRLVILGCGLFWILAISYFVS